MSDGRKRPESPDSEPETGPSPTHPTVTDGIGSPRDAFEYDATATAESDDDGESPAHVSDDESEFFFPADNSSDTRPQQNESPPGATDAADTTGPDQADEPDDGFGTDAKAEAMIELIGDAQNLLLMGPLHTPADYDLCTNLLVPDGESPEQLLLVTFEESPDERLNILRGHLGSLPETVGILNVGDATRSRSANDISTVETGGIRVRNVRDGTDIQRMGLAINSYLSEWGDGETVLCFHSLSALLRASDSESVFRFLNVLLGRVRSGNIRAHYHVDPDAHDEQTLETYRPLFDETIRYSEDGSTEIDR